MKRQMSSSQGKSQIEPGMGKQGLNTINTLTGA